MDSSDLSFELHPSQEFLDEISTYWPKIADPVKFVLRYGPAIQKYIAAIVRQPQEAEDACQDFLVRFFERGFQPTAITRGRFRDYLKTAARNAALTRLRKRCGAAAASDDLEKIAAQDDAFRDADELWAKQWRTSILERVWRSLEELEKRSADNLYHTVLRLMADNPTADSATLAAEVARRTGKPYRADAFRKQTSRARRVFAQCIIEETRQTLSVPTADNLEQELIDLDLWKYVRDFLPSDWRETGMMG